MEYSLSAFQRLCQVNLDIRARGATAARLLAKGILSLEIGELQGARDAAMELMDVASCVAQVSEAEWLIDEAYRLEAELPEPAFETLYPERNL